MDVERLVAKLRQRSRCPIKGRELKKLSRDFHGFVYRLILDLQGEDRTGIIESGLKLEEISRFHPLPEFFISMLWRNLKSGSNMEIIGAIRAFSSIGYRDITDELIVLLEHEDKKVRWKAGAALWEIHRVQPISSKKINRIIALSASERPEVRLNVAIVLGNIGTEHALKTVSILTQDESPSVRRKAVIGLRFYGGANALLPLVLSLDDNVDDTETRQVVEGAQISLCYIVNSNPKDVILPVLRAIAILIRLDILKLSAVVPHLMLPPSEMEEGLKLEFYNDYVHEEILVDRSASECLAILVCNYPVLPQNVREKADEALKDFTERGKDAIVTFRDFCVQRSLESFELPDVLLPVEFNRAGAEIAYTRRQESPESVQMDVTSILEHLLSIAQGRIQGSQQETRSMARKMRGSGRERRNGLEGLDTEKARKVA